MKELVNDKNATIVDVRTVEEFELGSVKDSINIPMHLVPMKLDEFKEMSKPLILCCASGNRSGQVATFLSNQGIEKVYNAGGWTEVYEMLNH